MTTTDTENEYVNPYSRAQEERALEIAGYTIVPDSLICPRIVAGLECQRRDCMCKSGHAVYDHARMWRDKEGNYVLTSEPYSVRGREIAAFSADVQALGLEVALFGQSFWNPGNTLLIRVTKAEEADSRRLCTIPTERGTLCLNDVLSDAEGTIAICGHHAAAVVELVNGRPQG
ncbi:hypothetical protein Aph01nite_13290 [Acrocarpospora phusangensis]|uniref:Uncharacterized protein n=1 Tax=Acrocarpospora phusangensis TaxID=1070424 RepID=A0A919Q886_9ACTN|nr:hypothetical protein [Acrocarpospora phusangensis]GIH23019.1 hypothetical protein Aph01nite_13290 [Acrocarpospora phusangensis]